MTLRTATLCLALAASPAAAQAPDEGRSLMEQGAEMFFRGLMSEMEPALQELREFADGVEPALRDFVVEMGPALRELLEEVEDWSAYQDSIVVVKGCGSQVVPPNAYLLAMQKLQGVARKLMFGEPCSSVPLWRKPKAKAQAKPGAVGVAKPQLPFS